MKNRHVTIGLLLFVLAIACKKDSTPTTPTTPADVNLRAGLLLYLPFNGTIADSSGNGNTTTAVAGATLTYDEHGYANSAFGSTGNGERIKVTNNGSIKFDTAYSISYDFMQRDNSRQTHISMVTTQSGNGPSFSTGTSVPGMANFDAGAYDTLAGCDNYGTGRPNALTDTTTFIPQPESWYNAILIYRKGAVQLYINGKLISIKVGTGTRALLCPAAQIVIGGWWDNDPNTLNGKMDEVRLYNRVLNADEIAELSKNFK